MNNSEYLQIIDDISSNSYFNELKKEKHHYNSNRLNHSYDVSYKSYLICKKLKLDYVSATRAALLHDFFFDKDFDNKTEKMFSHPKMAVKNSLKITSLNEKEINIIRSHMYPIGGILPKSFESVIVDVVDDYVSLKEKLGGDLKNLKTAVNFLFILLINIIVK